MHLYLHLTAKVVIILESVSFSSWVPSLNRNGHLISNTPVPWQVHFDNAIGRGSKIGRGSADAQSSFYDLPCPDGGCSCSSGIHPLPHSLCPSPN